MSGSIYALHNGDFNYRYFGKTTKSDPIKRLKEHRYHASKGANTALYHWMRKHGVENIQMCIIETFDEDAIHLIDEREIFHIAQGRAYSSDILNGTDGGDGLCNPSDEVRAKISVANSKRTLSPEHKAKLAAANTGRKMSEAHKQKLRDLYTGVPLADEHKAKISASLTGKVMPAEVREKIREANTGKKRSEESNARQSEYWREHSYLIGRPSDQHHMYGKHHSEESRKKISESLKGKPSVGMHVRHHVNKDVVNPKCLLCVPDHES